MPPPRSIEWSDLTPASLETVAHVALRVSAGFDLAEIALLCERERETFQHLPVPAEVRPIGKAWCSARMRELRTEIAERGAVRY